MRVLLIEPTAEGADDAEDFLQELWGRGDGRGEPFNKRWRGASILREFLLNDSDPSAVAL